MTKRFLTKATPRNIDLPLYQIVGSDLFLIILLLEKVKQ